MAISMNLKNNNNVVQDPPIARFLFSDKRMAIVWTIVRIFVGYQWLSSGLGKLSNPAWTETGEALQGFFLRAVAIPETGKPAIAFDWYREFLQGMLDSGAYTWFSKLIVAGEVLVGIALVIGAFVGIAAFFGAFMNWNFIMAGTASSNGLLLVLSIMLVLAWKVAGYYGADFYLLSKLGTPWGRRQKTSERVASPVPASY
jgi:thiosulfate dehydrogenase [quinone] large subunit